MYASVIEKMIIYNSPDVRRINHALKVFSFAQLLSEKENCNNDTNHTICISSILHDIGIHNAEQKYNSTAGNYQEAEGPIVAKELLIDLNIPNTILERVLYLIGNHHTYNKIDNIDFQILVEADFLVNIDEDKIEIDAIDSIKRKIFKTNYGLGLINTLYP